jgi:hypothetical protein
LKRDFILATLAAWKQRGTASFKARLDPVINEIYDIYFNDAPLSDLEALLNEKLTSLRYIRMRLAEIEFAKDKLNLFICNPSDCETNAYLDAQIKGGNELLEVEKSFITKYQSIHTNLSLKITIKKSNHYSECEEEKGIRESCILDDESGDDYSIGLFSEMNGDY